MRVELNAQQAAEINALTQGTKARASEGDIAEIAANGSITIHPQNAEVQPFVLGSNPQAPDGAFTAKGGALFSSSPAVDQLRNHLSHRPEGVKGLYGQLLFLLSKEGVTSKIDDNTFKIREQIARSNPVALGDREIILSQVNYLLQSASRGNKDNNYVEYLHERKAELEDKVGKLSEELSALEVKNNAGQASGEERDRMFRIREEIVASTPVTAQDRQAIRDQIDYLLKYASRGQHDNSYLEGLRRRRAEVAD